jgi:zinc finger SWIM domain-containing protein 3
MEDRCNSLIPSDIETNRCEEVLRHCRPKECKPVNQYLDDCDVVPTPQDWMKFNSEDEVRSYYTKYANQEGFGIMTGKVVYFILACSRQGSTRNNKKSPVTNCSSGEQKCEARIIVCLCEDGAYRFKSITLNHNHELNPNQVKSRNSADTNKRLKRTLDPNDQAEKGVKSFGSLVVKSEACEDLAFCKQGFRNYIPKEKRLIGEDGDGHALHKYFMWMQEQDNNFFYAIDFDDSFGVKNVFWADGRSRAAYKLFGDVVKFDSTYLSNQYKIPLTFLVGVNHHGQSILFGCGLLSSEDTIFCMVVSIMAGLYVWCSTERYHNRSTQGCAECNWYCIPLHSTFLVFIAYYEKASSKYRWTR